MTSSALTTTAQEILQRMQNDGMIVQNPLNITTTSSIVCYKCYPCDSTYAQILSNVYPKSCRKCNNLMLTMMPMNNDVLQKTLEELYISTSSNFAKIIDEEWRPIIGAWISSYGRCINVHGKVMMMDEKDRYFTNKKLQYAKILMAEAFKDKVEITDEAKVDGVKTNVTLIDAAKPLHISNLKICTHAESCKPGKPRTSDKFKATRERQIVDYLQRQVKFVVLPELPNHILFEDGNMYNKAQTNVGFLTFTTLKDRRLVTTIDNKSYHIGKLFCVAFHPIEGKTCYDHYKDVECNHKDGNTANNAADNLEWVTHSANMSHAYQSGLNKKVRQVDQYACNKDGSVGDKIASFISIAQASRETKQAEHVIRLIAQHKRKPNEDSSWWRFQNEEQTAEWSSKFTSKKKNM